MTILVLRHAHAGARSDWTGDDAVRPLSERGWRQANGVVEQYTDRPVERILSSPLTRCVQTVEPLADARGLRIEQEDAIAEGATLDAVTRLLRDLDSAHAVLCSHGDVIELLLTDLHHRGVTFTDPLRWQKGSTWVLDGGAEPVTAAYLPPPA
ncbi:MAG: phosphoglycerate mutase family protein [Nitriliruptor sp.]|nr:MAG: phosphoglycerate mutase family protein [Nitriliruptor sp.]